MRPAPVHGVLFDLDDTMFDQASWLSGAWDAVARAAAEHGVELARFRAALGEIAAQGSDQGRIIDRALEAVGSAGCPVAPLVEAFRSYKPPRLETYPGAAEAVRRIRAQVPVGLVSDGDPVIQRGKLEALGLQGAFDVVVLSDELGREHRKPDPAPFRRAARHLALDPAALAMVGDRPGKDVAGAAAAGMRAVRVLTGEYRHLPDEPPAWLTVADVSAAAGALGPFLS